MRILADNVTYVSETFAWYLTGPHEVEGVMKNLDNTKATDEDGIPVSLLKSCSEYLTIPGTHIINICFQYGVFPVRMKYAIIKPIHKKGDKTDINNYRPIALISNVSKVLEKLI